MFKLGKKSLHKMIFGAFLNLIKHLRVPSNISKLVYKSLTRDMGKGSVQCSVSCVCQLSIS